MSVLTGTSVAQLSEGLGALFTPLTAASFLVFTLLYTPCVAAVATVRRELGSRLQAFGVVVAQCAVGWVAACLLYQIGRLFVG